MTTEIPADDADARARAQFQRNKWTLAVDFGMALLFFVVGKMSESLVTPAQTSAGAGLVLIIVQRFVKVDLLGGLALFGVAVLCVSAAFAWFFQDDWAIKMRSTIVGGVVAAVMFADAIFNRGNYFGGRLARFMPNPIDHRRMAAGLATLGVVMALVNWGVAKFFSKDIWLAYTSFGDIVLSVLLAMAVIRFAERKSTA
ncbi:MAG: septation protein IspZ [Gammaproteobacteria bacterium]